MKVSLRQLLLHRVRLDASNLDLEATGIASKTYPNCFQPVQEKVYVDVWADLITRGSYFNI